VDKVLDFLRGGTYAQGMNEISAGGWIPIREVGMNLGFSVECLLELWRTDPFCRMQVLSMHLAGQETPLGSAEATSDTVCQPYAIRAVIGHSRKLRDDRLIPCCLGIEMGRTFEPPVKRLVMFVDREELQLLLNWGSFGRVGDREEILFSPKGCFVNDRGVPGVTNQMRAKPTGMWKGSGATQSTSICIPTG
jgi:hypothetical protein